MRAGARLGDPRPGTNGWNAPWPVAKPWMMVYQNETRLIGRPELPVIITETGWSRDFCTEEERANWQVEAWQAWNADPQLLASCPFDLMGPRIAGFPWINASGTRLPVFTDTVELRCRLLPETCVNCLAAEPDPLEPSLTGRVSLQECNSTSPGQLWLPAPAAPGRGGTYGPNAAAAAAAVAVTAVAAGAACTLPTGNITLSVNVSASAATGGFRAQYLSCRADGQPTHMCQLGDDVNIWFYAGVNATNQQWSLRSCAGTAASLLVSAFSGACVSSESTMVACDCADRQALWTAVARGGGAQQGATCALVNTQ